MGVQKLRMKVFFKLDFAEFCYFNVITYLKTSFPPF